MKYKTIFYSLLLTICLIAFPVSTKALNDVFINGASGVDTNSGTSPTNAVKSFSKAKSLLDVGGTIWVTNEIDITTSETWDLENYGTSNTEGLIRRWDGISIPFTNAADQIPYKGKLIYIADGISLSLSNLIIDGNKDNVTANSTGMLIQTAGDLTIEHCILKDNKAPTSGVAINSRANTSYRPVIKIKDSMFTGNEALSSGSANGTIAYDKGRIIIDNTTFSDNYNAVSGVITSAYKGGITDRSLEITNSTFTNNSGDRAGLSIDAYDTILISDTIITNSTSTSSTNYLNGASTLTLNNVTVSNNTALNGGAFYLTNGNAVLNVYNSTLENNTVTTRGGAIFFNNGTLNIKDSIIKGNTSSQVGAGIYYNGYGVLNVEGTNEIIDNINASTYGNIYIPNNKYITVKGDLVNSKIGVLTATKPTSTTNVNVALPSATYVMPDDTYKQFISDIPKYATDNAVHNTSNNKVILTNSYVVTFDYVDGLYNGASSDILYVYKRNLTTSDYNNPSKTGYELDYYTNESGVKIDDMTAEYIDSSRKYIAVYKRIDYDVTFTTMYGGIITGTNKKVSYEGYTPSGVSVGTISSEYDFIGWEYNYTAADGTNKSGVVTDYTTVQILGNVTFKALIAKKPFVSVISTGNGYVSISKTGTTPTNDYDIWQIDTTTDPLPVNAVLNFEPIANYMINSISFVDLYGASHSIDLTDESNQVFSVGENGQSVTVKFDKVNKKVSIIGIETTIKYTVTFDLPKAYIKYDIDGVIKKDSVYIGDNLVKPVDPMKDGYKFIGWYSDSSYTTLFDFNNPITEDVTIFAKFEKIETNPDTSDLIIKWVSTFTISGLVLMGITKINKKYVRFKLN